MKCIVSDGDDFSILRDWISIEIYFIIVIEFMRNFGQIYDDDDDKIRMLTPFKSFCHFFLFFHSSSF